MVARTLPDNFPFKKETPKIFINCGFSGFFQRPNFGYSYAPNIKIFKITEFEKKCKMILELFKRQLIVCQNCTFFQIWDLMRPGKLCASLTHLKKDQDTIIASPPTRWQVDLFKDLLHFSSQNNKDQNVILSQYHRSDMNPTGWPDTF